MRAFFGLCTLRASSRTSYSVSFVKIALTFGLYSCWDLSVQAEEVIVFGRT